jgi:hypothetical protein
MIKYSPVVVVAATLVAAGCQSHTEQAHSGTSVVTVVSTASTAPGTDTERREVLQRFTSDIWPAVVAYNGEGPSQGGPGNKRWAAITDQGINADAWNALRDNVHHLGVVSDGDNTHGPATASDALRAIDTHVSAVDPPNATVQVCYTFTAVSYPSDAAHPQIRPGGIRGRLSSTQDRQLVPELDHQRPCRAGLRRDQLRPRRLYQGWGTSTSDTSTRTPPVASRAMAAKNAPASGVVTAVLTAA